MFILHGLGGAAPLVSCVLLYFISLFNNIWMMLTWAKAILRS